MTSTPGIPKQNTSLNNARSASSSRSSSSSLRARASGGLSSAQRTSIFTRALGSNSASRSSGGWVSAKRSFNPYDTQSALVNKYARMRAEANRYAGRYNTSVTGYAVGTMSTDNSQNVLAGIQMGMQAAQSVFGLLNQAGVFGNDKTTSTDEASNISTATTLNGKLTSASSFSTIKNLESQVETKKANLSSDYNKLDISDAVNEKLADANVKAGLDAAGVNIDTSALGLSTLDSKDLDKALETIDSDINKITNFQTSTLPKAKAQVTEKSGEVSQQITTLGSQIMRLESQIEQAKANGGDTTALENQKKEYEAQKEELEAQKTQLDAATKAVDEVISQCGEAINDLEAKKSEINDLKEFEDNVKDKKYDLAKSQDEQLKKTMDQINTLTKQINSLQDKNTGQATKSDQNRLAKYNMLIQQRSGLYQTLGTLTESLSSAGETEFTNSKGKTYKLQNLDKAMSIGQEPDEEA